MERVYKVARWLPAVIVPIAIWWLFYTPTIGKAGLALAVVATLMPIAWEKSNGLLRSAWIATVFLLFFVEYAAINKAEADNRAAQAALLKVVISSTLGDLLGRPKSVPQFFVCQRVRRTRHSCFSGLVLGMNTDVNATVTRTVLAKPL